MEFNTEAIAEAASSRESSRRQSHRPPEGEDAIRFCCLPATSTWPLPGDVA